MNFDQGVMDYAIGLVHALREKVVPELRHSASNTFDNQLQLLENVRTNQSLRGVYSQIRNQCVVLLVSYFGAATKDLLIAGVQRAIDNDKLSGTDDKVTFTLAEL